MDIAIKVKQARAYGKQCVGCQDYNGDVMIAIMNKDVEPTEFYDFFFNQASAEKFHKELGEVLRRNVEVLDDVEYTKTSLMADSDAGANVPLDRLVSDHRSFLASLREKVYSGADEIWDELDGYDAIEIAREMLDRAINNIDELGH